MTTEINKIPVSEIFASIQGEGQTVGFPSIFVRLAHCNLKCSFCDTKYTWENPKFIGYTEESLLKLIIGFAYKYVKKGRPHIVFTGGEPMLYWKRLFNVIRTLHKLGYIIEIETNGKIGRVSCRERV